MLPFVNIIFPVVLLLTYLNRISQSIDEDDAGIYQVAKTSDIILYQNLDEFVHLGTNLIRTPGQIQQDREE
jgi:hypothetical protein